MAKGQCKATILQGGIPTKQLGPDRNGALTVEAIVLVGASVHRCNKDAGHEKAKDQPTAIHDSSGVTWYEGDLNQFDSED